MTEGYDRDDPSGDGPFNICPRGGDYGASDCLSPLSLAHYLVLNALKGQVRPQTSVLNAGFTPSLAWPFQGVLG